METRFPSYRRLLALSQGLSLLTVLVVPPASAADRPEKRLRLAGLTTEYRHNSHADLLIGRLFQTQTLDGKGERLNLELASLFTDQVPEIDTSRKLAAEYKFPIYDSIDQALTLGTGKLAVDGILLIAEHGKYPESPLGQFQFPKRRFFEQVVETSKRSGRVVPVFLDKHLADTWRDAKWIYDTARELKIPLMAGSSVPLTRRYPPADVRRGAKIKQIVALSYHRLDSYGIHALENVQSLAERRAGDETGVVAVQCFVGDAVWEGEAHGAYDAGLLASAFAVLRDRRVPAGKKPRDLVPEPVLWVIDYADGLRGCVFTLQGAVAEWSAAWRYDDNSVESALFATQEWRPFMHFGWQMQGVDEFMHTGRSPWPLERTLLTTGLLDALLTSMHENSRRVETKHLQFGYRSEWNWKQPPEPPPDRPLEAQ